MLFDGKKFAKEREARLKDKVSGLSRRPVLVSVLVGENPASELYTKMKKSTAERVGIQFEVVRVEAPMLSGSSREPEAIESDLLDVNKLTQQVKRKISKISKNEDVDGVMVQLPLPDNLDDDTAEILTAIDLEKDVDGLRWQESGVMPATVRGVISILEEIAKREASLWERKFVVVGYTGNVGVPLTDFLQKRGVEVEGINSKTENVSEILRPADVVISCVGKPGLIKAEDINNGVVVVDVGIDMIEGRPRGDMEAEVYEKASIAVPVPGGVGPITVVSLLESLVDIA